MWPNSKKKTTDTNRILNLGKEETVFGKGETTFDKQKIIFDEETQPPDKETDKETTSFKRYLSTRTFVPNMLVEYNIGDILKIENPQSRFRIECVYVGYECIVYVDEHDMLVKDGSLKPYKNCKITVENFFNSKYIGVDVANRATSRVRSLKMMFDQFVVELKMAGVVWVYRMVCERNFFRFHYVDWVCTLCWSGNVCRWVAWCTGYYSFCLRTM